VSGGFTTAAAPPPPPPPPTILSVSPTNGAVNVPPLSPLVFTFDEDMDTNIQVVADTSNTANAGFSPSASYSNGVWSADRRSLTFPSLGQLPLGFVVSWTLNPPGAGLLLQNLAGEPLARSVGSFTVQTNTGGNPSEICQTTTSTLGHYSIIENLQSNLQVAANAVVPLSNSLVTFVARATNPQVDRGGSQSDFVTNGSLTLPGGSVLIFTNEFYAIVIGKTNTVSRTGDLGAYYTNSTDLDLADFPPGTYVIALQQESGLESTIPLSVPGPPPAALIGNYDAAQAIDPGNDFVLQWNSLPATNPGPFIQLVIRDSYGKLIFAAPNPCVGRTLDPGATSVLIPANTFRPGVIYQSTLEFAYNFYHKTNAVPELLGDGTVSRTTLFSLRTTLAPNTAPSRPEVSTAALASSGHPMLTIHGAPGASYTIQRTGSLFTAQRGGIGGATWTSAGTITTDGSGNASFTDLTATLPAFYRVLSN
ncbi:MAG TPA: Ig-like domain-containing protein, partial [Verrucomicrobiae bacterium]|nr:Ig-like domain-containing protein [Verrucomicrobiae bacterium]